MPPQLKCTWKTWVLGTFFSHREKIFGAFGTCHILCTCLLHVCSIYLVLQTTMPQRLLSVYFSFPVQPSPRAKREEIIDALLHFRFTDRTTSRKRQEAYNEAQKACTTSFLSVPMATLCEFVAVAQKMATRDTVPVPVPRPMEAPVQASLILTDKKNHCHLA